MPGISLGFEALGSQLGSRQKQLVEYMDLLGMGDSEYMSPQQVNRYIDAVKRELTKIKQETKSNEVKITQGLINGIESLNYRLDGVFIGLDYVKTKVAKGPDACVLSKEEQAALNEKLDSDDDPQERIPMLDASLKQIDNHRYVTMLDAIVKYMGQVAPILTTYQRTIKSLASRFKTTPMDNETANSAFRFIECCSNMVEMGAVYIEEAAAVFHVE